ncbi:exonuclease [Klebsiella phage VLCpiS11a]|uniref:exonuclease n=1 Tax=Klebsiella phage VLCpiS11a TaxID=2874884 RepID=UPI0022DCDC08|nr:exonuclease [Klebsiella phage VLCpiS11a]UVX30675.1 exonuclease [Klebsiella phage VLCpiS11a]
MTNSSGSNHEHALLSPSGSKKWLGCSASLLCEKDIPNESGQAAINGTAMHAVSEDLLNRHIKGETAVTAAHYKGVYVLNEGKGPIKAVAGKPPAGSVLINDEFVTMVGRYTDYALGIISSAEYVKIEMRAELTKLLHPGYTADFGKADFITADGRKANFKTKNVEIIFVKTFGTADLVAVIPRTDGTFMLFVGDLKTGRHAVDAKENKQLMLYALAILAKLRRLYDITLVRLAIFQPYCGGPSEWDITPEGLDIFRKFASKRAIEALDVYYGGKKNLKASHFRPSADACQWCRFNEKCNARTKAAIQTGGTTATDADLGDDNHEMTPEELKAAYEKLPELRQHIATIEKAMHAALLSGVAVPGYKLVTGNEGNRKWSDAAKVTEMLEGARIKRDMMIKESLISPTDAEKVFKTEKPRIWRRLEKLIERAPGKPTIAAADDPRAEWKQASDEDLS